MDKGVAAERFGDAILRSPEGPVLLFDELQEADAAPPFPTADEGELRLAGAATAITRFQDLTSERTKGKRHTEIIEQFNLTELLPEAKEAMLSLECL